MLHMETATFTQTYTQVSLGQAPQHSSASDRLYSFGDTVLLEHGESANSDERIFWKKGIYCGC